MYLAGGAVLSGFNLQGGGTRAAGDAVQEQSGGGVWCETVDATVTNCNLTRNAANFGGGGVYSGTLIQCTFNGNASQTKGGGAYGSTLNQCTLINNSSQAEGGGACRSILNQCNLYYNSSQTEGGGAYGSALSHCTLNGNEAQDMVAHPHEKYYWHYVGAGGGVSSSRLNSCTLIANTAATGGGANASTLTNCTLTGNAASVSGGGVQGTFVTKCVFIGNTAPTNGNYDTSTLDHSCVAPLPASGTGNFTNAPLFVKTSVGDFHLQSNSPCLNAGLNTAAPGATDLDGRSRIVGGTVDVGAYEFQDATSNQSTAWLGQHGLPVDASSDTADPDGDGASTWQEWRAGTDPTNALSALRLLPLSGSLSGVRVSWWSVTNRAYVVERASDLGARPAFQPLASGLPGQPGTTSFTDSNAPSPGPGLYRVGIQP